MKAKTYTCIKNGCGRPYTLPVPLSGPYISEYAVAFCERYCPEHAIGTVKLEAIVEQPPRQYRVEVSPDGYYCSVAAFSMNTGERLPYGGMSTSWTIGERDKALAYANAINRANGYPEVKS